MHSLDSNTFLLFLLKCERFFALILSKKQRNSNLFYANALSRINKVVFNVIPLNELISGNPKFIRNSPDRIARYYGIVARTCRLIRSRCRTADPYALTRIDVIIFDIVPTAELVHRDTKFISNRPNRVPRRHCILLTALSKIKWP